MSTGIKSKDSKTEENKYQCKICGKIYSKMGISTHIWRNHTDEGRKFISTPKGSDKHVSWNKGLTKETNEKIRNISKKVSITNKLKGNWCKGLTKETSEKVKKLSEKIRDFAIKNNNEKYITKHRIDFPYEKNGKIINLQSSYELIVARELDKYNISWTRPEPLPYIDQQGISRKYYPDFFLNDFNLYLDPKNNYLAKKDKYKIESVIKLNHVHIIILGKEFLKWEKIKELIPDKMQSTLTGK